MKDGLFITVEGGDGAGKSTQLQFIKKYFEERGEEIVFTREPGGTDIGEKIRKIILDPENTEMSPVTEMLLYAACRAQLVSAVIEPALEEGKIVICDRYLDSSLAYQGYARGLGYSVSVVNSYAINGCMPDATFLLKLEPKACESRVGADGKDRIENEDMDFHSLVYQGYLELEAQFPERIVGIDARGTIEEVSAKIKERLDELTEGR